MKINISLVLPIKAYPIDEHYGLPKEKLDVQDISMGQSSTNICLMGYENKHFNSIHFKFYLRDKEIDIYKSGLINHYMTLGLKGICYIES